MDGALPHVSVMPRGDAMRSRCAGSRCALPGTGRHKWRPYGDIAACFRRAARPLRRGTTRCVPIAAVHVVPCRAPGVMNGAPTVHCRAFPSCRMFVAPRDDAMRYHCGGSRCALPGTGRHEWRPYGGIAACPRPVYAVNEGHRRKKSGERLPSRQECVNLARLVSSRPKSGVPAGTHNETHTFLYYNLITQSTNH